MFKSLKRIAYKVDDIAKAKEWYCGILGAKPAFDSPFMIIFQVGGCALSLSKGQALQAGPDERCEAFWEVDDVDDAYQRLIDAGAKPLMPAKSMLTIRFAKVVDPFGNMLGITGMDANAKNRTVENQPSESALTVTFCRALAAQEKRQEIKGPDYLAKLFLTDEMKKLLSNNPLDNMMKYLTPLYATMVCRTAFIDHLFTQVLAENIPQIVFLGAGYDTRSYRFKDIIKNTRIYEIDAQSTQKRKLSILKEANIEIPKTLQYISANFKTDTLEELLANAGYKATEKTLFIWEGVTYYLTKEAVERTLLFIKNHSVQSSSLCLDYLSEKHESVYAAEPFLFWMTADEVEKLLAAYDIQVKENIDATEMEKRYLMLKDGTLAEKALPQFALIYGTLS
jgi:methyltransferase (TIGR00027 family)